MITESKDIKLGRDVTIDVKNKRLIIRSNMYDIALYSFCKNLWLNSPYHIKYAFPFVFGGILEPNWGTDWEILGMSKLIFYHKDFIYQEQEYLKNNNE